MRKQSSERKPIIENDIEVIKTMYISMYKEREL